MRKTFALIMLVAMPAAAAAQSEGFVIKLGQDTIAMETFVHSVNRLDGDLSGSAVQVRHRYSVSN